MDNLDLIDQRLLRLENVIGNFENLDQDKVSKNKKKLLFLNRDYI
jgi:hypothetical protein